MMIDSEAHMTMEPSSEAYDLITLSPGLIEGGNEQIIARLLPRVVNSEGVRFWTFDQTRAPATVVQLVLEIEPDRLGELIEMCEDLLSGTLRDEPAFALRPLVEMPQAADAKVQAMWGVGHRRISRPGNAAETSQHQRVDRVMRDLSIRILTGVVENGWDRKSWAPSILSAMLATEGADDDTGARCFAIMQILLTDHPKADALTRKFRESTYRIIQSRPGILPDSEVDQLVNDHLRVELQGVRSVLVDASDLSLSQAMAWRRVCGQLGFSLEEAAYIACLASAASEKRA